MRYNDLFMLKDSIYFNIVSIRYDITYELRVCAKKFISYASSSGALEHLQLIEISPFMFISKTSNVGNLIH